MQELSPQRGETSEMSICHLLPLHLTLFLSRVLMARAQRLTEQVKTMAARIKQLELALANAENGPLALAALGDSQASLQDAEPNDVEYEGDFGEDDSVSKLMGSLAVNSEGQAHYYGATAGAEVRCFFPDLSPSH
jgi:hypothetical protein